MAKKNHSDGVQRLAEVLEKKEQPTPPNPKGGNPPEQYRFRPGAPSANPKGRPPRSVMIQALTDKIMHSRPPAELLQRLGIAPEVTWAEALLLVLCRAGLEGDVQASREVLCVLGFRGTGAQVAVQVNADNPSTLTGYRKFVELTRWVPEAAFEQIWALCRELSQPPSAETTEALLPPDEEMEEEPRAQEPLMLPESTDDNH